LGSNEVNYIVCSVILTSSSLVLNLQVPSISLVGPCHEHNTEVQNLFLDFKQAFDSVNIALIPNYLKLFTVPSKLIKLTNIILKHTKVKVKIDGTLKEQF
jgi:hypothetical protein